jgi:hypothetical protein
MSPSCAAPTAVTTDLIRARLLPTGASLKYVGGGQARLSQHFEAIAAHVET